MVLGLVIIFVTLIGRPDVPAQGYSVELDFDSSSESFEAVSTIREIFVEKLEFPVAEVNLTAHPGDDSIWSFSASSQSPKLLVMENSSGSIAMNLTRVSSAGVRNWDYFVVQGTLYWFNASSFQADVTVRVQNRERHVYPELNLTSRTGGPSPDVWMFATFVPAGSVNRIQLSGRDFVVENETGALTNLSGESRLTLHGFDLAYFGLSTSQSTFLLHPGARVRWFGGALTIRDADGVVTAADGLQHRLENSTLLTKDPPRRVEFRVVSLPYDYGHIVLRFELDATTIQASDSTGPTNVGQRTVELISVDWWPGKTLNVALITLVATLMTILSWVHPD